MTIAKYKPDISSTLSGAINHIFFLPGWQLAKTIFTTGLNEKNEEQENENDLHPFFFIQPFALPSEIIFGLGSLVTVIFYDSVLSAITVFTTLYNAGLAENEQIKNYETRDYWKIFSPLALPGIITGFLAALSIIILIDNLKSFLHTFVNFFNEGIVDNEDTIMVLIEKLGNEDECNKYRKYFFAFPGLIAGSLSGLLFEAIYDNMHSCIGIFFALCNLVLPDDYQLAPAINTDQDKRADYRKFNIHTLPAIIVGGILGTITAMIIAIARLFIATATFLFTMCINPQNDELNKDQNKPVANNFYDKKLSWSATLFREPKKDDLITNIHPTIVATI